MLVIGMMLNLGITIIAFLAFIQLLWKIITKEKTLLSLTKVQALGFGMTRLLLFFLVLLKTNPFLGRKHSATDKL